VIFQETDELKINVWKYGWPFVINTVTDNSSAVNTTQSFNLIFWILVSLIILSLIRYFKNNQKVKSK
jgi:hypothetical protein